MAFLKIAAATALAMGCATQAPAANFVFAEVEPNDTIAQAQRLVTPFGMGDDQSAAITITGSLVGEALGVVDWYSFYIPPIVTGQVYREIVFTVFKIGSNGPDGTFLSYRFTQADGRLIDPSTFRTQTGGTYYLGINNPGDANGYNALIGITAVPEPATWALMLAGFAMTGYALRRRRASVAFA